KVWPWLLRLSHPNLVEPHTRGFDPLERFLLHLGCRGPFGRARECAAGNRPMVRALGGLKGLERCRMLLLPLEPPRQMFDCLMLRHAGAFAAEPIAGVGAFGVREPPALPLYGRHPVHRRADS